MGLLYKLLGGNKADMPAECGSRPDMPKEDLLLLRVQELQARVAEMQATLEVARAQLRKLSRLYS